MKRFISFALCLVLVLSLFLSMGCKEKIVFPDREAHINYGIETFVPQMSNDENLVAVNLEGAVISADEEKQLWSYKYLSYEEKGVYRIMLTMVRNLTEGFVNLGKLGKNSNVIIAKAFRALSNDYPEYYWMPSSYYINVKNSTSSISFKKNSEEDSYGYTIEEIHSNNEEFNDAILRITEKTKNARTPFEKEVIIHDELCNRIVYDSEFESSQESDIYSAFGALVYGHAVCEGYARAFKLLCKYIGIECILVTGDSKGVGHMWNMVKLDDNWYHVDVTWDDLRAEPLHTYLNQTELNIRADHDIDLTYDKADSTLVTQGNSFNFNLPKATCTDFNYFRKNGLVLGENAVETFTDALISAYKNGQTYAELSFENTDYEKKFKENYEDLVVEIQELAIEKMGKMKFKLKTISFPTGTCVIYFTT